MPVQNGDYICTRHEKIIHQMKELQKVLPEFSYTAIWLAKQMMEDVQAAHHMGVRMEQGLLTKNRAIKKLERKVKKLEGIIDGLSAAR